MTIDEKRKRLMTYCRSSLMCSECKLNVGGWTQTVGMEDCLDINLSPENDLDRALKLISEDDLPIAVEDEPIAAESESNNPYWDRITAIANRQRSKGVAEYGHGIEKDPADINVRLDRIEEELIDALMYIEHLRDCVNKIKEVVG